MTIKMAAKNQIAGVRTFYVESESDSETKYMVVEVKRDGRTVYYCQCDSFFARNLPFIGLNLFQHCKHGVAVREAVTNGKSV